MLVSKNWLEQFIESSAPLNGKDIAAKLSASTVEVEKIIDAGASLENIVVGKVVKVIHHPNADRLKVCEVDVTRKIQDTNSKIQNNVQIVCGGSNVREGMMTAVALPGAYVKWHGEGESIKLEETKIRGVESFGMICAADEIGLGEKFLKNDEKEIVDLEKLEIRNWKLEIDTIVGKPLAEVLGLSDVVFDIDNKSLTNRPDLMGHYGMAREVAALFGVPLKPYVTSKIKADKKMELAVTITDPSRCRRYMAVAMEGIVIAPSPEWLQARLLAAGVRPINNMVDITNYVMMELGQPMHVFDVSKVAKSKEQNATDIFVRNAKAGEKLLTLDGKERELSENILVIADSEKPLGLAGIMGGEESSVQNDTVTIIFESANFDAMTIRKMSADLGLRTDASARFEKTLDPELPAQAMAKAVSLVLELCPTATVTSNIADAYPVPFEKKTLSLPVEFLIKKVGFAIGKDKIVDILTRLGFDVKGKGNILTVAVPTWRATKDISIPEDLVEEVIRVYGYNAVPSVLPLFPVVPPAKNELRSLEHEARVVFATGFGYTEVYNYSFLAPEFLQKLGLDNRNHLELENPIAKDRPLIRRSLLPGLIQNVENNAHRFARVALFEIGKVFQIEEKGEEAEHGSGQYLPKQDSMFGLAYTEKGEESPYESVAEVVAQLALSRGCNVSFERVDTDPLYHPGRSASVRVGNKKIGIVGELHPDVQVRLGIESRVGLAEVDLNELLVLQSQKISYQALSQYPSVTRDTAFLVGNTVEHAALLSTVQAVDPMITHVELFDVFMGKGIPNGKKSMAYHIVYQSKTETLASVAVDLVHAKVVETLQEKFQIEPRT